MWISPVAIRSNLKLIEMKILAIEKGLKIIERERETEILKKEAHQLFRLFLSGHIKEIFFNDSKNAILILECENIESANELLNSLPLVNKQYTEYDLMQINPLIGFNVLTDLDS